MPHHLWIFKGAGVDSDLSALPFGQFSTARSNGTNKVINTQGTFLLCSPVFVYTEPRSAIPTWAEVAKLQPRPVPPGRLALFLRSFHSFTKECLATLLPPTGSALFFKTAGCMGFLPILEWGYRDGRSPRICARVAPCGLPAFSRKDQATRQPSRKFERRVERRLRGGRHAQPAQGLRREAAPPRNMERREDGG